MDEEPQGAYRKHGHPAETIGLAAVAAFGLEAVLPAAGAPGWVLPASEIVASSAAAVVTWSGTGRKLFPAYLATLGGFLGTWTAVAQASGLWSWDVIGTLVAGMSVLVPAGVWSWHRRNPRPVRLLPAIEGAPEYLQIEPEPDENAEEMRRFEMMFEDFKLSTDASPVTVTSLAEDRSGRILTFILPDSGEFTIEDFRAKARHLEVRLRAQEGAVTFEGGGHSGKVVMRIRERDGLAGAARLTPELRARTVNEEFAVGVQEDGSLLRVTVRESHFMIIGIMGSGKSNLLNVLIAQLASCVDTVIWMIDMKGGRAARPWFQAWSEGNAVAPPVDWLATSRAEAEMMVAAFRTAVETRSASGIGGNKIIPSAGRPQIILVCDEMADLFGDSTAPTRSEAGDEAKLNTWFQKQGVWLTQHSRSEAGTTIWASQRGTNGMSGTGDMKANIDVSIALRPKKYADLQYILEDVPHLAARQVSMLTTTPGVGMLARGPRNSQITKFFHHDHIEGVCGADESNPRCPAECPVYQSAVEVAPVRPRLDHMTARSLGTVYAQRWARADRDKVLRVPVAALAGGSAAYSGGGDTGRFEEIIEGLEDPERDLHPARIRMREYLASRGAQGAGVAQILTVLEHEGISVARETVHRWLREDRDAGNGMLHHPGYRRWVWGAGPNVSGGDGDDA